MSLLSVYYEGFWIQSPLGKAWESSNVPCASCRRSLKSCLGRGCAWHRARFLRGTKRSGMSKLKECRCGHYSQSKTETQFNSDSKDQKIYCIETELSKHKKWVHVWLYDSAEFSVYHLSPFFWAKNLPRRNTIVTIAWRTSSWRNWRRPHRRVLDPWSWPAVLGKGWRIQVVVSLKSKTRWLCVCM